MIALVRRRQEMPVRKQDDDGFQNKLHLSKIDFHTPPLCGKALHSGADALTAIRIIVKGFSFLAMVIAMLKNNGFRGGLIFIAAHPSDVKNNSRAF